MHSTATHIRDTQQAIYLPWPPWMSRHRYDHFYLCCVTYG